LDRTIAIAHLARRWGTSPKSVRRLLRQGTLGFEQIGGSLRVPLDEVRRLERQHRAPVP
jgi:excisionase family DNA binding protein